MASIPISADNPHAAIPGHVVRGYVDGVYGQLHYRLCRPHGAPAAPPLVLLHQNPSSSLEYRHLIVATAADRLVVAFDTPGYGMSDPPPAPIDMAGYAGCFAGAIGAWPELAARPVDLYGFHTGTLLAIETALAAPGRIRRLVLTGIPMLPPDDRATRLAAARTTPPLDEEGGVALDLARRLWDFVVAARTPGMTLDDAAALWSEKLKPLDRASWAYLGVWGYDYAARLPLVDHPVLVLQPDETIAAASLAAAARLPTAVIARLPGPERDIFHVPASVATLAAAMRRYLDEPLVTGVKP